MICRDYIEQTFLGNLQEVGDIQGSWADPTYMVLAVDIIIEATSARRVGVCLADPKIRELAVSEFLDNDHYSALQVLLSQLNVRECLIKDNQVDGIDNPELVQLQWVLERCGVTITKRSADNFGTSGIKDTLDRLVVGRNKLAARSSQANQPLAMGPTAALIKHLGIPIDTSTEGGYNFYRHDPNTLASIDFETLKALRVFPEHTSDSMSIHKTLDRCETKMGRQLLARWLKQPLKIRADIKMRQKLIAIFCYNENLRETIRNLLPYTPDPYSLSGCLQGKELNKIYVSHIFKLLSQLKKLTEALEGLTTQEDREILDKAYRKHLSGLFDSLMVATAFRQSILKAMAADYI
ncbi:DNA mismatch repair protein MutS [Stachybotrys elegans]|uniref:DNA mismatch repair protein MutS n=1 Tax=Stachybotrys elegans TaxID=80388 RepID=A0A8K0SG95_9HYPO|nr:DNA mismatch repair protein MutS [Stachybotrys elegans]